MAEYSAEVIWQRQGAQFTDNRYSRGHIWRFDGGQEVAASASPHVVPLPYSVAANVDPEEAFVASLSSCHMLFFLSLAAQRNLVVDHYSDHAIGTMGENSAGKMAMLRVALRPEIVFSGSGQVENKDVDELHHLAHEACFIANSVLTEVVVEPR